MCSVRSRRSRRALPPVAQLMVPALLPHSGARRLRLSGCRRGHFRLGAALLGSPCGGGPAAVAQVGDGQLLFAGRGTASALCRRGDGVTWNCAALPSAAAGCPGGTSVADVAFSDGELWAVCGAGGAVRCLHWSGSTATDCAQVDVCPFKAAVHGVAVSKDNSLLAVACGARDSPSRAAAAIHLCPARPFPRGPASCRQRAAPCDATALSFDGETALIVVCSGGQLLHCPDFVASPGAGCRALQGEPGCNAAGAAAASPLFPGEHVIGCRDGTWLLCGPSPASGSLHRAALLGQSTQTPLPPGAPTPLPSGAPTPLPSGAPTISPRLPYAPSVSPRTAPPTTAGPLLPSAAPYARGAPSTSPLTSAPSAAPSLDPSQGPSLPPTGNPTISPRLPYAPSRSPVWSVPSLAPSAPSLPPSLAPYSPGDPSLSPLMPTAAPSLPPGPTISPSVAPYTPAAPSSAPATDVPSLTPTSPPTPSAPSLSPSNPPVPGPTVAPTAPTASPLAPTRLPSGPPAVSFTASGTPTGSPHISSESGSNLTIIIAVSLSALLLVLCVLFFISRNQKQAREEQAARSPTVATRSPRVTVDDAVRDIIEAEERPGSEPSAPADTDAAPAANGSAAIAATAAEERLLPAPPAEAAPAEESAPSGRGTALALTQQQYGAGGQPWQPGVDSSRIRPGGRSWRSPPRGTQSVLDQPAAYRRPRTAGGLASTRSGLPTASTRSAPPGPVDIVWTEAGHL
eukprot:TRINITY_DN12858_c0_g1_i2.p1 TRINITY_DN12858_c0_g1~~TRINITY_DN12858_c0_g1_i2.p1  ORF type:complete len:763 (+),score=67.60 TRINITY_DN12858_c0_g1_i2:71-2290(+)